MLFNLALAVFPLLVLAAAVSDALTYRIPNLLTAAIVVAFPLAALLFGMPMSLVMWHLLAGAGVLVVGFGLFAAGFIGGGDAKLMAAAALWIGTAALAPFIVYTALAGGALAVAYFVWNVVQTHIDITSRASEASFVKRLAACKADLPYGVAIGVGAFAVYPHSWWFASLH
ncbi:MAG TPA: prepilin peptidase [Aestuariivirgaceae bacterium]|nr:prepilin peptidase [Aestuariivirgaceae bacterium]